MAHVPPSEFDVHILKTRGTSGTPDLFTIGVWDGPLTVRSFCHVLPIQEALVALGKILETAGSCDAGDSGGRINREPKSATGKP